MVDWFDTRTLGEEGLVVDGLLTPFVRGLLLLSFLDGRVSAGVGGADGRARASRCRRTRDGQGRRRRRVAHFARQVEEVYNTAKRDDRSTSLTCGWNWNFQGVSAAHVLPKVTSDRPLCSFRGERELAFCIDGVQSPSSVVHNCG